MANFNNDIQSLEASDNQGGDSDSLGDTRPILVMNADYCDRDTSGDTHPIQVINADFNNNQVKKSETSENAANSYGLYPDLSQLWKELNEMCPMPVTTQGENNQGTSIVSKLSTRHEFIVNADEQLQRGYFKSEDIRYKKKHDYLEPGDEVILGRDGNGIIKGIIKLPLIYRF